MNTHGDFYILVAKHKIMPDLCSVQLQLLIVFFFIFQTLNTKIAEVQQLAELKIKEYDTLKEEVSKIKSLGDSTNLESLFNVTSIKAQLEQLKSENEKYASQLQQEQMLKTDMERKYRVLMDEMDSLQRRYDDSDKERTEATMKLEVLNNYFKKRESELQE